MQEYIERAEDIRHSPLGKKTYSMRSQTIERVFADAKEKHGMRYTYYKGLKQVTNWVRLKFTAINLKKLAMWKFKNNNPTDFYRFLSTFFKCSYQNTKKTVLLLIRDARFFDSLTHESLILAFFAFSFYSIYGPLNPTLMLKSSINFPAVPFCSQHFPLVHHQKSIKEYLYYCASSLLVV